MKRPIVGKVERSSFGTSQARAARRTVQAGVAAEVVRRANTEVMRRANAENLRITREQLGGDRPSTT